MMDVTPWLSILEKFVDKLGVPMTLLVALMYAIFRVSRWLAPRADELKSRHFELIDAMVGFANESKSKIGEIHGDVREVKRDIGTLLTREKKQ